MLRKTVAIATLATLGMAQPLLAAEHTVLILGEAFFPEITYANPGDTIVFVNASEAEQTVAAHDDSWTVGPIQIEQSASFQTDANMQKDYVAQNNATVLGAISFDPAPAN